jgi:hypothetical protein
MTVIVSPYILNPHHPTTVIAAAARSGVGLIRRLLWAANLVPSIAHREQYDDKHNREERNRAKGECQKYGGGSLHGYGLLWAISQADTPR